MYRPFPNRERALRQAERHLLEEPASEFVPQLLHPAPEPEQHAVERAVQMEETT